MKAGTHLQNFSDEINGRIRHSSIEAKFDAIALCLMNYLCISVGNKKFKITECEFYYCDIDHQDLYVHCGDEQLNAGTLYFNKAGGLDITFGNESLPAWGGILIRGIRNVRTNEYFNQITKIVGEIFKSLGNILTERNAIFLSELDADEINFETPVKSTRIGLTKREDDREGYLEKNYRYITELCTPHKFKNKEKVIKQLLAEGKLEKKVPLKFWDTSSINP